MAKKEVEYEQLVDNTKIVKVGVEDEMKKSFIAYAMAVNVSRAIPDVRDGLKPVHRRILYAMSEMNLFANTPYKKCARIVGDVLGKYHPHGDSSVYDALVRLAQDFSINMPLVDGHGNFGSVDGDPPAAYRYTEARLSKISAEMLRDIDKGTVDTYPNFDDSLQQPVVLPARFPNLLVNGSDGIAVGMATSIPPHNLGEVIDGTVALIDNPELESTDLMKYIPAPDFPTGGLIMSQAGIGDAYRTGRGGVVIRARAEIEELPTGRQRIIVTELPYQVNKAKLIETIAQLVKDKRIDGISDIKEESDRKGMRIVIEIKKGTLSASVVLNTLFKHTEMQVKFGIILLALVDGTPKVIGLKEILGEYIKHQDEIIVRRTRYDLQKAEERDHILVGLVKALDDIDNVIKIIRFDDDPYNKLMKVYDLSDKQTNAILEMKLRRLAALEVEKIKEERLDIEKQIAEYNAILASPERIAEILKAELLDIKSKYANPRRSEITMDMSNIDMEDLIDKEDIVVSLTHLGYVKRISLDEYRSQHRGGMGITAHKTKDEDFVERMLLTNTHIDQFFFTNKGKVYVLRGYEIPEGERTARGRAIVNILPLDDGEKVTALLPRPKDVDGYLVLATRGGYIKKTDVREFDSIRKNGKIAISLNEGDELIAAHFTMGEDDLMVASSDGKCIRFSEQNIRKMGRTAQGVRSMKLKNEDRVVDMLVVDDAKEVVTISSKGFGKRTGADEFRQQGRAGMGVKAGVFNEETGKLVNLKQASEEDDLMLIADNGIVIRINIDEIRRVGRATKGVRIMRLKNKCTVMSVAVVPHEDEEELAEGGEAVAENAEGIEPANEAQNSDNI